MQSIPIASEAGYHSINIKTPEVREAIIKVAMKPDMPHPTFKPLPPLLLLLVLLASVLEPVPTKTRPVCVLVGVLDALVGDGNVDSCVAAAGVGLENVSEMSKKLDLALKESVSYIETTVEVSIFV